MNDHNTFEHRIAPAADCSDATAPSSSQPEDADWERSPSPSLDMGDMGEGQSDQSSAPPSVQSQQNHLQTPAEHPIAPASDFTADADDMYWFDTIRLFSHWYAEQRKLGDEETA